MSGRRLGHRARRNPGGNPAHVYGRLRKIANVNRVQGRGVRIEKVFCGRTRTRALEIGSIPVEPNTHCTFRVPGEPTAF